MMSTDSLDTPGLSERIAQCNARLSSISAELKAELFGIDAVIDRVIESVRAWYVLPEIIHRPVIVCLWGLTGTGKTQLTRSLAKKLAFYDRFVEVQMDGFSNDDSNARNKTISSALAESGISEGAPGILVLDEFQRYRTVDEEGNDAKALNYVDVWTLLSDGRLPPNLSFIHELEMTIASTQFKQDQQQYIGEGEAGVASVADMFHHHDIVQGSRFFLSPYSAVELKKTLKLQAPLLQVMAMSPLEVQQRLMAFRDHPSSWETDYSKLLVFVCGNLDELYEEMAARVEDCDSDADLFHRITQGLNLIDVKRALVKRFKPEQIARLGNNHVIYPSLDRATYEQLISVSCARYLAEVEQFSNLKFTLSSALKDAIYMNGVFPAQGTRPLFSSIHCILSAPLINFSLWAIEHGVKPSEPLLITVDEAGKHLVLRYGRLVKRCEVNLEIDRLRKRHQPDFRALLAVHEAAHGLVYALLFGRAPQEIKINAATFSGGYNVLRNSVSQSARTVQDTICVNLAGRAGELLVFGKSAISTGSEHDLQSATALASKAVRFWGFGNCLSRTDVAQGGKEHVNTDVEPSNAEIEDMLKVQLSRAQGLINGNIGVFMQMTHTLVDSGVIEPQVLSDWLGIVEDRTPVGTDLTQGHVCEPYARELDAFSRGSVAHLVKAA